MISDTLGYGPLDPLLQEATVTEIMCNSYNDIWIEQNGQITHTETSFTDETQYHQVINKIVSAVGRRVDESSPMVDARLPDGSRVNAIIPPLAIHGAVLTIRKFSADPYTAKDLINFGTWTIDLVTVMEGLRQGQAEHLVVRRHGHGQDDQPQRAVRVHPGERAHHHDRGLRGAPAAAAARDQPRDPATQRREQGSVGIRELVKNSLRMRPDRIIIGECRAAETLDMLQAMNTGHEGSMTTVHSNSARGRDQPARDDGADGWLRPTGARDPRADRVRIDLILQVTRLPDGKRVITSVTEVQGLEGDTILLQDIFKYRTLPGTERTKTQGELVASGLRPKFMEKLGELGVEVPASAFKAPAGVSPGRVTSPTSTRRRTRVPDAREIADRERLR